MKFLCLECDAQMAFEERAVPGDGTFAAAFRCPACGRGIAMLANPMETQLVGSLGVKIGGRTLDEAPPPLEMVRSSVQGKEDAFLEGEPAASGSVRWTAEARERLERVPSFVRGMVKRLYAEYARERQIAEISPEVMDRARTDLGLEGM